MAPKILVADDAKFMRRLLRGMLGEGGYTEVAEAADGEEAVRQFQALRPDLVLLDITMPGMPGMVALARIRALDPGAGVVICTAMGQDTVEAEARRAGACGFLRKPFVRDELLYAVRAALEKNEKGWERI